MNTPSTDVSPGLWGFAAFFFLLVCLYFLMRNMNARMRRMSYRQKDARRESIDPQATGDPDEDAKDDAADDTEG